MRLKRFLIVLPVLFSCLESLLSIEIIEDEEPRSKLNNFRAQLSVTANLINPVFKYVKNETLPLDQMLLRLDTSKKYYVINHSSLKKREQIFNKRLVQYLKVLYQRYDRVKIKCEDILNLYKAKLISYKDIIPIWDHIITLKAERKYFTQIFIYLKAINENIRAMNQERSMNTNSSSSNTRKEEKQNKENMNTHNYSNITKLDLIFFEGVCEYLYNNIFVYGFGLLIILFTKLFRSLRLNILVTNVLIIIYLYKAFQLYENQQYFASSFSYLQFIYLLSSNIDFYIKIHNIENLQDDYSIFETSGIKSKTVFYIKLLINIFFFSVTAYICCVHLRFFINYLYLLSFIQNIKTLIDTYFITNSSYCFQPLSEFTSVIVGLALIIITVPIMINQTNMMYDFSTFLMLFNFIAFIYLLSVFNFLHIQRYGFGEKYLNNIKLLSSLNTFNQSNFTPGFDIYDDSNFDEILQAETQKIARINFHLSKYQVFDILYSLMILFILIMAYLASSSFLFLIYLCLTKSYLDVILIQYSIGSARIISWCFYLLFLLLIGSLKDYYSHLNEDLPFTILSGISDTINCTIKMLLYVAGLYVFIFNSDFFGLFNLSSYTLLNSLKSKLMKEHVPKSNNCNDLYRMSFIIDKLRMTYSFSDMIKEIFEPDQSLIKAKLSILVELIQGECNFSISDFNGVQFGNIELLFQILDMLFFYASYLLLLVQFNNDYFPIVMIGYFHKLFVVIKFILSYLEYSKSQLSRCIFDLFVFMFLTRLNYLCNSNSFIDCLLLTICILLHLKVNIICSSYGFINFLLFSYYILSLFFRTKIHELVILGICVFLLKLVWTVIKASYAFRVSSFLSLLSILLYFKDHFIYFSGLAYYCSYRIRISDSFNLFRTLDSFMYNQECSNRGSETYCPGYERAIIAWLHSLINRLR